jgi:hypothetical protein
MAEAPKAPVATEARYLGKRERYQLIQSALWTKRSSFDGHWRELADYINPRRVRFQPTDNQGEKKNSYIIDSTGRFAARTLASGLHAGLTSPARPWMTLSTPDPEMAKVPAIKNWLHEVTKRMLAVFVQTNLYNALPIVYGDMGTFGTAAVAILEDERDLFRCYTYPLGSYALGIDERGLPTTFVREYQLTVRQVITDFAVRPGKGIDWSVISTHVKDQWDRGNYEDPVDLVWIVMPNEDADPGKLESKYLPWSSCHYEKGANSPNVQKVFLRESGFRTFPLLTPRWEVAAPEDAYGSDCPGMTALGDIKQLQMMQRRKGQGISKLVDPPVQGPSSLKNTKVSLLPGDITYVDSREASGGLRSVHEINLRLDHLTMDIRDVQYRIQRAYFEDLFLMLAMRDQQSSSGAPPTAREVEERHEEKLLALGPVLERTNDELLDPLIDRVYALMDQSGLLPEPPEELANVNLKVEYTSILAQAQKLVGVLGQDRLINTALAVAPVMPDILDKINIDQIVDNYGEMLGVDPRCINSTEDAQEKRDARAQQQQQMAAAQTAKDSAAAAKSASETSMEGDTALSRMLQNAGGAQQPQPPEVM